MTRKVGGGVAVVTGAARGIGAAILAEFTGQGWSVVACDILPALVHTVEEVNRRRGTSAARACVGDITRSETLDEATAMVAETARPLRALVNNAAVVMLGAPGDTSIADFHTTMDVNARAMWTWSMRFQPALTESGEGAIVNTGSTHTLTTREASFPYNVTKGAVLALTKALAVDLGPLGIRVNTVSPGIIDTDPTRSWVAGRPDPHVTALDLLDDHPLRRLPTVDEVARAVYFLASSASSGITGTELIVDCGRQVRRR